MNAEGTHHQETGRKRPSRGMAPPRAMAAAEAVVAVPTDLLDDLRSLIEKARAGVAAAVNVETVLLNWHLGLRIWREILGEKRANYGKQIVDALSRQLTAEYGRGFGRDNLFHMVRFARTVRGTSETTFAGRERSGHREARTRDHRPAHRVGQVNRGLVRCG